MRSCATLCAIRQDGDADGGKRIASALILCLNRDRGKRIKAHTKVGQALDGHIGLRYSVGRGVVGKEIDGGRDILRLAARALGDGKRHFAGRGRLRGRLANDEVGTRIYLIRYRDGADDVVGVIVGEELEVVGVLQYQLRRVERRERLPLVGIAPLAHLIGRSHVMVHGDGGRIGRIHTILHRSGELDEVAILAPLHLIASLHDDIVGQGSVWLSTIGCRLIAVEHTGGNGRSRLVVGQALIVRHHGSEALHAAFRTYLDGHISEHQWLAVPSYDLRRANGHHGLVANEGLFVRKDDVIV